MVLSQSNTSNFGGSKGQQRLCPSDDESSTSSTILVDNIDNNNGEHNNNKTTTRFQQDEEDKTEQCIYKKQVRFDLSKNQVRNKDDDNDKGRTTSSDDEDLNEKPIVDQLLWYSRADVKEFKQRASARGNEHAYQDSVKKGPTPLGMSMTYTSLLDRTYAACRRVSEEKQEEECSTIHTTKGIVQQTEDGGLIISTEDQKQLRHYLQCNSDDDDNDLIGLDKWILRCFPTGRDRTARRFRLIQVVLDLQDEWTNDVSSSSGDDELGEEEINDDDEVQPQQQGKKNDNNVDDAVTTVTKEECIRQACERISQPSRLFALAMADAQFSMEG